MSSPLSSTTFTHVSSTALATRTGTDTDELAALLRRCRSRTQSARLDADRQMWIERRSPRVGLIAASHFEGINVARLFPPFSLPKWGLLVNALTLGGDTALLEPLVSRHPTTKAVIDHRQPRLAAAAAALSTNRRAVLSRVPAECHRG